METGKEQKERETQRKQQKRRELNRKGKKEKEKTKKIVREKKMNAGEKKKIRKKKAKKCF